MTSSFSRPDAGQDQHVALWHLHPSPDGVFLAANDSGRMLRSESGVTTTPGPWSESAARFQPQTRMVSSALPGLRRPELTIEAVVRFEGGERQGLGPQNVLRWLSEEGQTLWQLGLNEHYQIVFQWQDREGEQGSCRCVPCLADLVLSGAWLHIAVVVRNMCSLFPAPGEAERNKMPKYSYVLLYCTRLEDRTFPQLVGFGDGFTRPYVETGGGVVEVGASQGQPGFAGALAQLAISDVAKMDNQFLTLGAPEPEGLSLSQDIPCGSGQDPRLDPEGRIAFCGKQDCQPSESFWFHVRLEAEQPEHLGRHHFRFLSTRGNAAMAASAHLSYDQRSWQRLEQVQYIPTLTPGGTAVGELHVTADLKQSPAYLAAAVPYLWSDIQRLEADVGNWELFHSRQIGCSGGGRPIHGWVLTDPAVAPEHKAGIFLLAGQHSPSEIFAARIYDALVRWVYANPAVWPQLQRLSLVILPVLNTDALHDGGNTSLSRNGINLNRDWDRVSEVETAAAVGFLDDWVRQGGQFALGLDLHAGGANQNHLRGGRPKDLAALDAALPAAQERAMKLFARHMGFRMDKQRYEVFAEDGKCRDHIMKRFHVPCFTAEMMGATHYDPDQQCEVPVTQELLEHLGAKLWQVCVDYVS